MKVIFDLDGTLADFSHRKFLVRDLPRENDEAWREFYDACDRDRPIAPMVELFSALFHSGHQLEIWTGRSEYARAKTEAWLQQHAYVPGSIPLLMRPEIDVWTPDVKLKHRWLLESLILPDLVFEDRISCVRMFRDRGIQCLHVADGEFK